MAGVDQQQALERAWTNHIASLKSEPLSLSRLAKLLRISRNNVRVWLTGIGGVEEMNGRFRVPVRHLPPQYFADLDVKKLSS